MIALRNYIHWGLLLCCTFFLILFSSSFKIYADEIEWLEVSRTNNELLSINPDSIKYNTKQLLNNYFHVNTTISDQNYSASATATQYRCVCLHFSKNYHVISNVVIS